jgi:uncharacterized protein Usg
MQPGWPDRRLAAVGQSRKVEAIDMSPPLYRRDYRLTTAEILYHLPDHPGLLQSFIWQDLDLAPRYPVLHGFLDFWTREIEGRLHSVRVASGRLNGRSPVGHAVAEFRLH